jgi:hypothetical protein
MSLFTPMGGVGAQEAPAEGESASATAIVEKYGWWNKSQQNPAGGATVPPPPDAPADGIYLAHDVVTTAPPGPAAGAPAVVEAAPGIVGGTVGVPTPAPPVVVPTPVGPQALGAVRFSIPEGAAGQLVLRLAAPPTSTPLPGAGVVTACITTSSWDAVQNGRYDSRPVYDCNVSAAGELAGDSITFELPATLSTDGISFDLAIVPSGDQPFRLSLQAPTNDSLVLTSVPESTTEEFSDFGSFEDPAADFLEESAGDSFAGADFGSGDFTSSFDRAAGSSLPRVAAPAAARRVAGRQSAVPAARIVNPFAPDASRGDRIMAVAVLAAITAGLWWVGGAPTRPPRLLGSLGAGQIVEVADERSRGIGRFARPRASERAPRLF